MASLFDPDLKLQWAKNHLDALAAKIQIIREANKCRISTQDDLENGWHVIRCQIPHDARIFEAALIAGDFIHCLRSCLDHLAWQLALLGGDTPSRDICFPICEKDSLDAQLRITRSTYGIPDAAISVVKSFQPYHSGDAYKSTHLHRLNTLWNIDKHRHIAPHGVSTKWLFKLNGVSPSEVVSEELDDGTIMRVPIAFKNSVEFNPDTPDEIDVFFGDRTERDRVELALGDFMEMYEFVATKVLPAFAGFFP